ncbi:MAG TPA: methylated-DNA--[protein]-cysteine S-methyltransferase [Blastocatellia bacterium]|nr:methylated-DNA--[protein]-cysteine S-methyltransferase [Blastocatellia bacterium]
MKLSYKEINSPVGKLKIIASAKTLVAIEWEEESGNRKRQDPLKCEPRHPILLETERQLGEYFAGTRTRFDLPLEARGSDFEKKVWRALEKIPYGKTRSYLDLAKAIGSPKACRAVGAANSRNPLPIVVPCHRVIGADGKLTGFAGGLERKASLLAHEARADAAP